MQMAPWSCSPPARRYSRADFEQLPQGGRLVVVIEDAHERPDAAAIVHGVLRRRPDAHVVISARPYALADLENGLRSLGVYQKTASKYVWTNSPYLTPNLLQPKRSATAAARWLAEWLGSVSPDCPLIIVVAAELSRRGSLDLTRLQGNTRIRREIMNAFRDAMTAGADVGNPDVRREVLNAVAALQPFRLHDDDCRSAMSALTSRPFDQVMPYLSALEAAQVLQRQGTSLRVVPDLLGDAVLAGAASMPDRGSDRLPGARLPGRRRHRAGAPVRQLLPDGLAGQPIGHIRSLLDRAAVGTRQGRVRASRKRRTSRPAKAAQEGSCIPARSSTRPLPVGAVQFSREPWNSRT